LKIISRLNWYRVQAKAVFCSIPIVSTFEEVLGIKTILTGFGLESDAIHSPNENYPLEQFFNGIKTIPLFYKYYAEMMK